MGGGGEIPHRVPVMGIEEGSRAFGDRSSDGLAGVPRQSVSVTRRRDARQTIRGRRRPARRLLSRLTSPGACHSLTEGVGLKAGRVCGTVGGALFI